MCGSCPGGGAGSALAETIENSTAIVNVPIAIAILFLYIFSTPEFIRVGNAAFWPPHARCPIAGGPVGTSSTAGRSLRVGCASGRLTASHNGVDGLSSLSLSATQVRETLHRRCRRRRGRGQDGNPAHPIERGHPRVPPCSSGSTGTTRVSALGLHEPQVAPHRRPRSQLRGPVDAA